MSEYYEVYRKRAGHFGTTPQERALRSGKREFKQNLYYSPNTVRGLRCGEKVFDGIILTHKQNELETSLKLYTDVCEELKTGDIIDWEDTKWMIWYQTITAYNPHNKFEIIQCKHNISWVDADGIVHSSICHIVGSQESKIKDNFRTWNELITPQPNKFLEIIMPYQEIAKETEIMINGEVWRLIEYDKTSVPGVIYMSFGESKLNELTDDKYQQLANADKQQVWTITAPSEITAVIGEEIVVPFKVSKNGILQNNITQIDYICGIGLSINENGAIVATESGIAELVLSYKNAIAKVQVNVGIGISYEGFISGDDYIRVTRSAEYTFELGNTIFEDDLNFAIDNDKMATYTVHKNICTVQTNSKNKLGTFTLSVEYNGKKYEKEIKIISLWKEV